MNLKEMLKTISKGDSFALVGIMFMLSSLVIITVRETYWSLIPLVVGFGLLGIGIWIDDLEKKRREDVKQKRI